MAYADYEFYTTEYFGNTIAEAEFPKWADRASRLVDVVTHRRLFNAYPEDEYTDRQIKMCICDMAEKMAEVDKYNKASAIDNSGKSQLVKAVSAGSESITYGTSESKYAELSKDETKAKAYYRSIVVEYLQGLADVNGIHLLYAGV